MATSDVKDATVKVPFLKTNIGKTLTAAVYLAVSAGLAGIVAAIQGDPALFGVYTPFINVALVFITKTFFDKKTVNA